MVVPTCAAPLSPAILPPRPRAVGWLLAVLVLAPCLLGSSVALTIGGGPRVLAGLASAPPPAMPPGIANLPREAVGQHALAVLAADGPRPADRAARAAPMPASRPASRAAALAIALGWTGLWIVLSALHLLLWFHRRAVRRMPAA